jgi:signal peptidase I
MRSKIKRSIIPFKERLMLKNIGHLAFTNRYFLLFLGLLFCFRGAIADWNYVPSGSMKPTLLEGDLILVDKLAFDAKPPYINHRLKALDTPRRGDIVIFNSEKADKKMVKRVIGLPGETVSMELNRVSINGLEAGYEILDQTNEGLLVREHFPDSIHEILIRRFEENSRHSFDPVVVPEDHYLVLGDNRDRSADSRYYGFIPHEELVSRSNRVLLSLDLNNNFKPRLDRFVKPLNKDVHL